MAYQGVLKDFQTCVNGGVPGRLPLFAISDEFDVRMMDSEYEKFCSDGDEMFRVFKGTIEKYDYDWAYLQIDDCVEIEPLGVGVVGQGNILRATKDYLPATQETLDRLWEHGFRKAGRIPMYLDVISRLKDHFGDTVIVTARVASPFTTASLIWGMTDLIMMTFDNEEYVRKTTEFCTAYQKEFVKAQKAAGADATWFGDCNASSHVISPGIYREFALEPAKELIDQCKAIGLYVINHNSEEKLEFIEMNMQTGPDVINIGSDGDIYSIYDAVKGRQCLSGNVHPITKLFEGTPDDVYAQTREIMERVSRKGGHIMCSGEMIPRETPEENMLAMIRATREW